LFALLYVFLLLTSFTRTGMKVWFPTLIGFIFLFLIGKYYLPPIVMTFYSFFELFFLRAFTGICGSLFSIFEGS
jgi:integral membrane sensor domain MASE1